MIIYNILFYFFAFFVVFSALMVITLKNPVHNVLWLILAFFSSSGIFMMLDAEFIAMAMVIVYVGAVAVLFLFVVMMLNINFAVIKQGFLSYFPVCILIAMILFSDLYLILLKSLDGQAVMVPISSNVESFSGLSNTHSIGMILYTDYFLPFQLAGVVLFVAMIGSIVLTLRSSTKSKKQDVAKQVSRMRSESISIVKVDSGKGVKL